MDTPKETTPAADILVVDDTPANLSLLCGILREYGYKVRPAPSGELALRAAATSPPDLILLDIDMPKMNGFEVCERLKADPALREVPVVFISALTDVADKVHGFAVGGVDYVTKPFQFEEVHARVATHLELRRRRRELQESYDRLVELESLRDSLVHMLVHDLRSPLMGLTVSLGFLRDEAAPVLDPELARDIEDAFAAVQRMAMMVTSVLDVNKLEAAKMRLRVEECDVLALAREVVQSVRPLAEGRELAVVPEVGEVRAALDRGIVFRVLQNLIANALKFAPSKGGRVLVFVRRSEAGLEVRVSDNGRGIGKEHHARIFEKFGQVEPGRRVTTGLGLPFARLAVQAHGGTIGVESEVGEGATFRFVIPDLPCSGDQAPSVEPMAPGSR